MVDLNLKIDLFENKHNQQLDSLVDDVDNLKEADYGIGFYNNVQANTTEIIPQVPKKGGGYVDKQFYSIYLDKFPGEIDALAVKVDIYGKPTNENALDAQSFPIVCSYSSITGKFTYDNPCVDPTAIVFYIKTEFQYYSQVDIDYEIGDRFRISSNGQEIELRNNGTAIQWKYVDDINWISIVALIDITGPSGTSGKEVELRNNGTYIQWKYDTDISWTNLILIADITGAPGYTPQKGVDYFDGTNGREIEIRNSGTNIEWKYVDDILWTNIVSLAAITGANGAELELQVSLTHIQWRLVGSITWLDLIALSELIGTDGREIELQKTATYIQWRYVGEVVWTNLVALVDITGPAGDDGITLSVITFLLAVGTVLTTGANKVRVPIPYNCTILKVYAIANTIPDGAAIIFDINKNGTSIWNLTPANRLKILDGQSTGNQTSFDADSITEGDIISVDVDQVGIACAGGDVTIQLKIQVN